MTAEATTPGSWGSTGDGNEWPASQNELIRVARSTASGDILVLCLVTIFCYRRHVPPHQLHGIRATFRAKGGGSDGTTPRHRKIRSSTVPHPCAGSENDMGVEGRRRRLSAIYMTLSSVTPAGTWPCLMYLILRTLKVTRGIKAWQGSTKAAK